MVRTGSKAAPLTWPEEHMTSALLSEYLMHERNRDRAFPYSRRNAFDVAAPHITGRENSWEAGLSRYGR
jgi:hypothetical protein